jgi:hypothetical protein
MAEIEHFKAIWGLIIRPSNGQSLLYSYRGALPWWQKEVIPGNNPSLIKYLSVSYVENVLIRNSIFINIEITHVKQCINVSYVKNVMVRNVIFKNT